VAQLSYQEVNEEVLKTLSPPSPRYWLLIAGLLAVIGAGALAFLYQTLRGMGVAGLNSPVAWATYITNFVFWVGIAHSGTLISAILYLFRVDWRTSIYRSSEAMTIFAIMTAGLFPLIHLGRVWVFYYILPYFNYRHLWPNFKSPLVWDVVAVSTYFTVSVLFFYLGMVPDIAAARDRMTGWRRIMYRILALGWLNKHEQWRHYARAYVALAALATPLVISVHSVVSWDFAMSLLPGWHTTIFAPYFVAGAIHSGLAMVTIILIPLRRWLRLERLLTMRHFEAMAQLLILMGLIIGYSYAIEVFYAWYSADVFERQYAQYRLFGHYAVIYWGMIAFNVLAPMAFFWRRVRTSYKGLIIVCSLILIGMWIERYDIIVTSLSHDFLPSAWRFYHPTWVEVTITIASFAWFGMLFLLFTKFLPSFSISEAKEEKLPHELEVPG
jgi:molybdopterin-containing oxidoreductase family membrane subunit